MTAKQLPVEQRRAGLPHILSSPKNGGDLKGIFIQPVDLERRELQTCELRLDGGVHADHWAMRPVNFRSYAGDLTGTAVEARKG